MRWVGLVVDDRAIGLRPSALLVVHVAEIKISEPRQLLENHHGLDGRVEAKRVIHVSEACHNHEQQPTESLGLPDSLDNWQNLCPDSTQCTKFCNCLEPPENGCNTQKGPELIGIMLRALNQCEDDNPIDCNQRQVQEIPRIAEV